LVKVGSGFLFFIILTKYNAPEELGKLGQLLTLSSAVMMFGTLGIQNKLIQDFAVDRGIVNNNYLLSMAVISLAFGFTLFAISYFFFVDLAKAYSAGSTNVFWMALITAYLLSIYVQFKYAMFNGYGDYKRLAVVNIMGSVSALVITYIFLFIFNGYHYQFLLIMCYPCVKAIFLFGGLQKEQLNMSMMKIDLLSVKNNLQEMKQFVFMAVFSIIIIYGYQYTVRIIIANYAGWNYVGQWQILQKHSEVISLIFTSIAALFIIPKLAKNRTSIQNNISNLFGKNFLVIGFLGVISAKYIGEIYVVTAFGSDYRFAGEILYLQIMGDVFKIVAYCYTLQLLCNSWVKLYVVFEVFQYAVLLLNMLIFLELFGVNSIAMSNLVSYLVFLAVTVIYFKYFLKRTVLD
jgi:O-antigen/teichoic acid export membrane protein